jgi:diguanylate cyclase (GGDEF)-like protein
MDGPLRTPACFELGPAALSRLMPMHLCLSEDGYVTAIGSTLSRLIHGEAILGQRFFDAFQLRRPTGIGSMASLLARAGARLYINPGACPEMMLRGIAVPLHGGGALINLSFGSALLNAVRDHAMTESDFAPTDLAVELLYLVEAKTAIMDELRHLNERLKGARQVAEENALTDTLTGLRNRRAMDSVLTELVSRQIPFGLMHVDLDYFKQVNDTLGHAAGDALLQHVAMVLMRATRAQDTVARVGGDEFVIIFHGLTETTTLMRIGSRLIESLTQPFDFDGQSCQISASIGITVSTLYCPPEPDRMLSDADQALYASKHAGRGRVSLHKEPDQSP